MEIRYVIEEENLKTFKTIMSNSDMSTTKIKEHYEFLTSVPVIIKTSKEIHQYHMRLLKPLIDKSSDRYMRLLLNRRRAVITYLPDTSKWHVDYYIPIASTYVKTNRHYNPDKIAETPNVNFKEMTSTEELGLYKIYNHHYVQTTPLLEKMKALETVTIS